MALCKAEVEKYVAKFEKRFKDPHEVMSLSFNVHSSFLMWTGFNTFSNCFREI